jgi:hypothetical protein
LPKIFKQIHFSSFSLTFIQAFDAILFTGSELVANMEEWEAIKKSMKMILLNLARIPTNIQEGITSSSERLGYMF